jgi:hypothetical protein
MFLVVVEYLWELTDLVLKGSRPDAGPASGVPTGAAAGPVDPTPPVVHLEGPAA